MKPLLTLAAGSAWHRRGTLALVALSIALAAALLLGVERLRLDIRQSFSQAVSGTDLVVGARTGPVQLMLYSVFRVGGATQNISMDSVRALEAHRAVAWVVPLSLGDSYRGRPVLGTTRAYFEHFRYGDRQPLRLAQGRPFVGEGAGLLEVVLGAEVAQAFGHRLGDRLAVAHGAGPITEGPLAAVHDQHPFTVVGILEPTGTPVDRTLHVSLQALEALHADWVAGVPLPGLRGGVAPLGSSIDKGAPSSSSPPAAPPGATLEPRQVTAALVGLKNRVAVFAVQRFVNDFEAEPLLAVLPGVALDELWQTIGVGERALMALSALVAGVSLAGLVAVVLAGLNERRRELAVLRAVGAGPRHVLALLLLEGSLVTAVGVLAGAALAALGVVVAGPWVQQTWGITLGLAAPGASQWGLLAGVLVAGILASLVPAWRAYRWSLADGLAPRG